MIRNGCQEEGCEEEGHEEEGCEEEEVTIWTWHVLRGLVGSMSANPRMFRGAMDVLEETDSRSVAPRDDASHAWGLGALR